MAAPTTDDDDDQSDTPSPQPLLPPPTTQQATQSSPGLLQRLNSLLAGTSNGSPLFYTGLGILSQRGAGSTPFAGIMQGQQALQQARAQQMQNQMAQLQLQRQQMLQQGWNAAPPGAPPQAAAPPGQPPQMNFAPVSGADIAATQLPGGLPNALATQLAMADPKNPTGALQALQSQRLAEAQRVHSDSLNELSAIAKGDIPANTIMAPGNEGILSQFQAAAKANNLDLSTTNGIRQTATKLHGALAGSLSLPAVSPTLESGVQTVNRMPQSIDPRTGVPTAIAQPQLSAVQTPGSPFPTNVLPSQALGGTPYERNNAATAALGAGGQQFNVDQASTTGELPNDPVQRALTIRALAGSGVAPATITANRQRTNAEGTYQSSQASNAGSTAGRLAAAEGGMQPALDRLTAAASQFGGTSLPPANALLNAWRTHTGSPAAIELGAALNNAQQVMLQLQAGRGGGQTQAEREQLERLFSTSSSPAQIGAITDMMKAEQGQAQAENAAAQGAVTRGMGPPPVPTRRAATAAPTPAPQGALDMLRANPHLAPQFKAKYGYLPN